MGFWKWHNELWNDPEPIIKFGYFNDGQGNKDFGLEILGSNFRYKQQRVEEQNEDRELLEHKKFVEVEHDGDR